MTLRVVFMGTPAFAVPALRAIIHAGHLVPAVYTRAPSASGRGLRTRPSPVGAEAEAAGLPVETPPHFRDPGIVTAFAAHRPDVAVVVAYGHLLPQAVLDVPRFGCLNLHASLLPRWRGAAPIQRAIMAGDTETGIAVMRMEAGLDTGPVAAEARVAIAPAVTAGTVHDRLAELGASLVVDALAGLETGSIAFAPQSAEGVTYARKIANDEARIDWSMPASAVHDHVRGLSPVPGAFFETDLGRGPERVKVLEAEPVAGSGPPGSLLTPVGPIACQDGALRLVRVQRSGRAPVAADEFWRGARLSAGAALG